MVYNKQTKLWEGPSKSESRLSNKSNNIPQVSALMAQNVSEVRKTSLSAEVDKGMFRDGLSNKEEGLTPNSFVTSSIGFKKSAQILTSGSGSNFHGGMGDTVKQSPEIYSPLWMNSNMNFPKDRATLNSWCRAFYALNAYVHNAINLHSTYPISKLNIKCPNKDIEKFFNDMIEEIDLMNVCVQIAQEYWLLGETFVYADFDQSKGKWRNLLIQNPDYMVVNRTIAASDPIIMLRPDEHLRKIVFSNKSVDIEQRKQLPDYIVDCVKRGHNIPLNNFNVSHLARRISPYEIRGTGLPVCIFRQLMLFDKLRESKYAQADNMINPLTLVKIGTEGMDGLHPTHADLEAWRAVFEQAQYDKDFKIFTHPGVDVVRVGHGAGIYDISGDITQIIKEIYVGLQIPSVIIEGGDSTTYANGTVALDALRQRYMQFRNMMSSWLKKKIFAPISKIQGFYDYSGGEKQLIVPEVDWNHMSLFDTLDYVDKLITLRGQDDKTRQISLQTICRSLGLEYEDEIRKMRKEDIQVAIREKEKLALSALDLNALRSLDENDEIPETSFDATNKEAPVPGQEAPPSLPGLDMPSSPMPSSPPPPANTPPA